MLYRDKTFDASLKVYEAFRNLTSTTAEITTFMLSDLGEITRNG